MVNKSHKKVFLRLDNMHCENEKSQKFLIGPFYGSWLTTVQNKDQTPLSVVQIYLIMNTITCPAISIYYLYQQNASKTALRSYTYIWTSKTTVLTVYAFAIVTAAACFPHKSMFKCSGALKLKDKNRLKCFWSFPGNVSYRLIFLE